MLAALEVPPRSEVAEGLHQISDKWMNERIEEQGFFTQREKKSLKGLTA